jgi:hypothetical protein
MFDNEENTVVNSRETYFEDDSLNPQQLALITDQIHEIAKTFKRDIYKIGKLLTEAKELVGHGNFKKYIKDNFDFSYPTANNLMNVYNQCLPWPSMVETIPSTVLYAISSPNFPPDLRELLFNHGYGLSDIDKPKIKDILKKYNKKEIDLSSPEIRGLIKYNDKKGTYFNYKAEIDKSIDKLRQLKDTMVKVTSTITWPTIPETDKLEMTKEQDEALESILDDMEIAMNSIIPERALPRAIKPNLKETIREMRSTSTEESKI